jgi:hypothetical protein
VARDHALARTGEIGVLLPLAGENQQLPPAMRPAFVQLWVWWRHQGMAAAWTDLLAAYSDEQLHLFLDLFDRLHQMSQQQLASLDRDPPSTDTATS